ncbi:MAG: polysaccharide biosynthesis/export family protein [Paludibacteraceae bacterium]|nr:polysaccharide biosynthesis/export family protein [Paludibacteraceae bacterium]
MNKSIQHFLLLSLVALSAASCVTQKKMTYLRDASPEIADSINKKFDAQSETVIRSGDALTIVVSALDKEAVAPFNLYTVNQSSPGSAQIQTTSSLQYYIVDEDGYVEMPILGKIFVAGKKRVEVEQTIREQLERQVLNPMVKVNLIGAKVSVLGEVKQPGYVSLGRGRLTILEALAAAGDLTPYGRRENVLLTREVDGKLEFARLDLGDVNLYTSPYYYLQQNDVIYVSPNKVRVVNSANVGLWLSMVSTVASAATVIVTVVSLTKSNNNTTEPPQNPE